MLPCQEQQKTQSHCSALHLFLTCVPGLLSSNLLTGCFHLLLEPYVSEGRTSSAIWTILLHLLLLLRCWSRVWSGTSVASVCLSLLVCFQLPVLGEVITNMHFGAGLQWFKFVRNKSTAIGNRIKIHWAFRPAVLGETGNCCVCELAPRRGLYKPALTVRDKTSGDISSDLFHSFSSL